MSLIEAVRNRDHKAIEECLQLGESPDSVDAGTGQSALEMACWAGDELAVDMLLDAGADPCERSGSESLITAASQGYAGIVELLLHTDIDIDSKSGGSATALAYAASGGYLEVVEMLLEAGADATCEDDEGETAIVAAAQKAHRAVVKILQPHSTTADCNTAELLLGGYPYGRPNRAVREFLDSVKGGDIDAVSKYLADGHDPNVVDRHGIGAIRYAMSERPFPMLDVLIRAGASVNIKDDEGQYPLYWAAQGGSEELFQYFEPLTEEPLRVKPVKHRQDLIDAENWRWHRPEVREQYESQPWSKEEIDSLFSAINFSLLPGSDHKITDLLSADARLAHAIKPDGTTALMKAVACNNFRLVTSLIEDFGAKPNATNVRGHCALREARPQIGKRNPSTRKRIFDFLEPLTSEELQKRVTATIERESRLRKII